VSWNLQLGLDLPNVIFGKKDISILLYFFLVDYVLQLLKIDDVCFDKHFQLFEIPEALVFETWNLCCNLEALIIV
jgi:hypothetical protein